VPEPVRAPVELQIERGLPGAGARVARRDATELIAETGANGGWRRGEQRQHRPRYGRVARAGGIDDVGAIVLRAVAVDVGAYDRRERHPRREPADRADLQGPAERH